MDGEKREERWGSIYTAHADFMNGWTVEGAHYMTERCMNKGIDCGSAVPYRFTTVKENALVDSTAPTVAHPAPENLVVSDNWQNGGRTHNPETMTLVKFPIPPLPQDQNASLFKYQLRIYGGKVETNGADQIFFYPASNDWSANSVTGIIARPVTTARRRRCTSIPNANTGWWMSIKRCARRWRKAKPRSRGISAATVRAIATISTRRTHSRSRC